MNWIIESNGVPLKHNITPSVLSTFLKDRFKIKSKIQDNALGAQWIFVQNSDFEEMDKVQDK